MADVIDIWPWSHLGCEGGWGRNAHYPLWCTAGSTNGLSNITREDMIEHPLFMPFTSEMEKMSSTNLFSVSDVSAGPPLKARFLADAITAESHAAGANYLRMFGEKSNVRMDMSEDNGCMANEDKRPEKRVPRRIVRGFTNSRRWTPIMSLPGRRAAPPTSVIVRCFVRPTTARREIANQRLPMRKCGAAGVRALPACGLPLPRRVVMTLGDL